jgi:hypothetical protein
MALSIGCRLIVSNTRDAPPFANEKPAVPGPSDEALYDAAAKPEAAQARGVGEGDGDGDAAGLALGAGEGAGAVGCASVSAGSASSAAAVEAAMKVRKRVPILRDDEKEKPSGARAPHGFDRRRIRRGRDYAAGSIASEGGRSATWSKKAISGKTVSTPPF